ncbi:MAG: MFS transporter [Polyangiales bacterium]
MSSRRTSYGPRYALVVVGIAFVALFVAAGLRGTPGVLMLPLERAFGWSRAQVSAAAALGILLYGLVGPFAAALMQSFGVRRTMLLAFALMAAATGLSVFMTAPWHLIATWGVLSGLGSGCVTIVLGATLVNRWFATQRGLVMGVLTASTATGTLLFMPALAALAEAHGWQPVVLAVSAAALTVIPLVYCFLPERPRDVGLAPFGAPPDAPQAEAAPSSGQNPVEVALEALGTAVRRRDFWLLFATFFVCGATTNGLVGTHLIALCGDFGVPEVRAAGLLATMGVFDLVGTTLSGWLTDRYDARRLLFVYYALRGLSLMWLPHSDFSLYSLSIFAVFYGLDWIATVPPTLRLTNEAFGDRAGPLVFAWVVAGHQIGAASATMLAGALRTAQGNYVQAFAMAGASGLLAAVVALCIGRGAQGSKRTIA